MLRLKKQITVDTDRHRQPERSVNTNSIAADLASREHDFYARVTTNFMNGSIIFAHGISCEATLLMKCSWNILHVHHTV